jgi:3-oxoacyl-ACP reductase-like protein
MTSKFSGLLQSRAKGREAGPESEAPEADSAAPMAPATAPAAEAPPPSPAPVEIPSPKRRGPKPSGKRSDASYEQTTIYIRKDLKKAVRQSLLNADDERDLSDLLEDLLGDWVKAQR